MFISNSSNKSTLNLSISSKTSQKLNKAPKSISEDLFKTAYAMIKGFSYLSILGVKSYASAYEVRPMLNIHFSEPFHFPISYSSQINMCSGNKPFTLVMGPNAHIKLHAPEKKNTCVKYSFKEISPTELGLIHGTDQCSSKIKSNYPDEIVLNVCAAPGSLTQVQKLKVLRTDL